MARPVDAREGTPSAATFVDALLGIGEGTVVVSKDMGEFDLGADGKELRLELGEDEARLRGEQRGFEILGQGVDAEGGDPPDFVGQGNRNGEAGIVGDGPGGDQFGDFALGFDFQGGLSGRFGGGRTQRRPIGLRPGFDLRDLFAFLGDQGGGSCVERARLGVVVAVQRHG
jgi:hypothetical protein